MGTGDRGSRCAGPQPLVDAPHSNCPDDIRPSIALRSARVNDIDIVLIVFSCNVFNIDAGLGANLGHSR